MKHALLVHGRSRPRGFPLFLSRLILVAAFGTALTGADSPGQSEAGKSSAPARTASRTKTALRGDGVITSEAADRRQAQLRSLGADRWHSTGYRGQSVKVAVLDSGFRGYREYLGKGLPKRVTTRSFRADHDLEARDSQHGILCGEVIHALAPEAGLLLANWEPDQPDTFLDAVRWARAQGARVISCSVIMPSWSDGEGGGPVHDRLAGILGAGRDVDDVLCFASAGNVAQRHWSGTFADDGTGRHLWSRTESRNILTPWTDERVAVEVCCGTGTEYEVQIEDCGSGLEVARGRADRARQSGSVVARFQPETGHTYSFRLRVLHGEPGSFHCVALGAGMKYSTPRGSIAFPADGPGVLAVGAVDANGKRMSYSACGPNSARPKPDLVATVPFVSLLRDKPFAGTSAAAPQAAATAALWWSRHPGWTANQVRLAMQQSAKDLAAPGHDWETGYGLVRLPE